MAKYVGKRIVPLPCGEWVQSREYEMLSVVLETSSGDSYIARRAVPAGTAITDTSYWAKSSDFSQQLQNVSDQLTETLRAVRADNDATEAAIRADNSSTRQAIVADNDATEQAIRQDNTNTRNHVDQVTGDALTAMNAAKQSFDSTSAALTTRMNSIAGSATEDTEILDARVDAFGITHENLGEAIRYAESVFVDGFREVTGIEWVYGFWNTGGGFNSSDPRRIRPKDLIDLKEGQRVRIAVGEKYTAINYFRKVGDTGVKNDDYERIGNTGWKTGVYEFAAPEDVSVEILIADEQDYNSATTMSKTDVTAKIYLLDNYAAQVLSQMEENLSQLETELATKTDNMDITAKGEVILTDNRCPQISGYHVFFGGSQLYFAGEKQWKVIRFEDIKEQLGDDAEISEDGLTITMTYNSILGFNVVENVFVLQKNFQLKPHICPLLYCYYGYMYGKLANRVAYRTIELHAADIENATKLRVSEKGFVYIGEGARVSIRDGDNNGGLIVRINGGLCVRFKGKSTTLRYSDMVETLGECIEVDEDANAATISIPRYSKCLVVSTTDYKLYIRDADAIQPEDFVLLYNGYRNKIGYLVNLETMQRVGDLENAIPNYLTKDEIAEQSFNSAFHKTPVDFVDKAQQYAYLLNELDEVETFLFFTDPHLAEFSGWEARFREFLSIIQKYYNSTPTSFCLCGGDWLGNSDLPGTACFKMGYIDGVMRSMFKNYYPIVGNHDTNYQGKATEDSAVYTTRLSNSAIRNLWYREEGRAYYDFRKSNTRFFVFDTGTENQSMQEYQWSQCSWFADELMSNQDAHIVLAMHIFYYSLANQAVQPLTRQIMDVAEAFNNRGIITINGTEYDFANTQGHIEFVLAGHNHADAIVNSFCVPVVLTINVRSGENAPSFDLCLIDYDNRQFKMVRIGDGEDRTVNF